MSRMFPNKMLCIVVGDSITKNIIDPKLSKSHADKSFSFPGATIEDIHDYIKPVLKRKPQKIILHVGTNNLKTDKP